MIQSATLCAKGAAILLGTKYEIYILDGTQTEQCGDNDDNEC